MTVTLRKVILLMFSSLRELFVNFSGESIWANFALEELPLIARGGSRLTRCRRNGFSNP